MSVLERFLAGDRLALAKIISHIEDRGPELAHLLPKLYKKAGRGYRVGLTGPPGAGKSTLVDKLAEKYATESKSIGIIAVDPSSPFTGGALLGDRIRMQNLAMFKQVFIRSMATRGSAGGLAASSGDVAMAMDAFGLNIILIETVGVGQVELDIADSCDTTVVVLVPESGDSIQALKAGLMEIADIFVINKADRPGAEYIASEISMVLDAKRKKSDWSYPILSTQAVNDIGVNILKDKIALHREYLTTGTNASHNRRRRVKKELQRIFGLELKDFIEKQILTNETLDKYIDTIMGGQSDPYKISEQIINRLDRNKK